jgi:hypothetical protein
MSILRASQMAKLLVEGIVLYILLFSSLFLAAQHSTTQVHGSTHIDYFLELAGYVDDGRTAAALNHQFRPIKKEAEKMRARAGTNLPLSHDIAPTLLRSFILSFRLSFRSSLPSSITHHLTEHLLTLCSHRPRIRRRRHR